MENRSEKASQQRPVWLSGTIGTFFIKLVLPTVMLSGLTACLLYAFAKIGPFTIRPEARWFAIAVVAGVAFVVYGASKTQSVGYTDDYLVVKNYWKEEHIPFNQIESVGPIWALDHRTVKIHFYERTKFGFTVYYYPKWGVLRAMMFAKPDKELKAIVEERQQWTAATGAQTITLPPRDAN